MKKLLYIFISFIISTNLFSQELITQENIHATVDAWLEDSVSTEAIYGHISDWDVSNVTSMNYMFYTATTFNGDLSNWDVSNVTSMYAMFNGASIFNGDLSSWNVSSVSTMGYMFDGATSFNGDLSSWDVSNVAVMSGMFDGASSLNAENKCAIQISFSINSNWPYEWECTVTQISQENIQSAVDAWLLDSVSTEAIYGHISDWDVSSVTSMYEMFDNASSFNGDISSWMYQVLLI
jgi:surface protein